MPGSSAPLGYYWGDDSYSVNRAPDALGRRVAGDGPPLERVRLAGSSTSAGEIAERVATATMFGGGALVVVSEPGPLVAGKQLLARLLDVLEGVADGNALAFVEVADGSRRPASLETLSKAVAAAGGEVREFKSPTQQGMARWIQDRAAERGIRISPPAAAELAERVGAFVRENDVDRRRQSELAVAELEKLAIYRIDAEIGPDDVKALVTNAVPPSTWAFLDAVGSRNAAEAAELADRLSDTPAPLLITQLHRRIRELIQIADMQAAGKTLPEIGRAIGIKNEWRAGILASQARAWSLPELDVALSTLLDLDAILMGHDGGGDSRRRSAVSLWIADNLRRGGDGGPAGTRPGR
jgi:DNA polymerase III delta subunit